MSEIIAVGLPWVMSCITIYMTLMAGNQKPWAWGIGLANQALWATWIVTTQAWGLLPMTIALTWVYARNHLKWMSSKPAEIAAALEETDNANPS